MRARIGIARRLAQFRIAMAAVLMDVLELCAERGFDRVPVSVERGERLVTRRRRNLGLPRRSLHAFLNEDRVVLQFGEEAAPLRIDRVRIACVIFVKLFGISGVAPSRKEVRAKVWLLVERANAAPPEPFCPLLPCLAISFPELALS